MSYLSLYFDVTDKNIFILGTGEVALRRAGKFLDKGANVKLAGANLDDEIISKGAKFVKIHTDKSELNFSDGLIEENKNIIKREVEQSDIVVIATGDYSLADYVCEISGDKLVNRADKPFDGNVIVPTSFYIGDVEFSIYTGGKSPLMAKYLRQKIQNIITDYDVFDNVKNGFSYFHDDFKPIKATIIRRNYDTKQQYGQIIKKDIYVKGLNLYDCVNECLVNIFPENKPNELIIYKINEYQISEKDKTSYNNDLKNLENILRTNEITIDILTEVYTPEENKKKQEEKDKKEKEEQEIKIKEQQKNKCCCC